MERVVTIEKIEFGMKASAGTVRRYRDMFGRDLIKDMGSVEEDILSKKTISSDNVAVVENVCWIMAKEYNNDIPDITEWLQQFSPYFIYSASPEIIRMWTENLKTLNTSRKK